MVSLEQLKETWSKGTQMQQQDNMGEVHDRVIEDIKHGDHWCKG